MTECRFKTGKALDCKPSQNGQAYNPSVKNQRFLCGALATGKRPILIRSGLHPPFPQGSLWPSEISERLCTRLAIYYTIGYLLHHLVMSGTIGRHDAHLLTQLLSNSARCISGVCAAKRCRVSKRIQSDAAAYKACRTIPAYRRLGPGSGPQPGGLSALSPRGKGPAGGSAGSLAQASIQNRKGLDCKPSQNGQAYNPSV